MRKFAVVFLLLLFVPSNGVAGSEVQPLIRVGVLKFGTVNWELDVLEHHRLGAKYGVNVKVIPLASKNSSSVALQGGAVDVIVTDWIWVSRMRAEGRNYTFFPYSMTVGALYVRPDAGINSLANLQGKKLGIAGGSVDKSWLLLRAYARAKLGLRLAKTAEPTFAAPPLLNQLMLKGDLPAVLNFWHYGARLEAAGMQSLIRVTDLIRGLGIEAEVPLLGWVFDEQWAEAHRTAVEGFLRASYAAKRLLAASDTEWERLRPLTKAEDDVTLIALRDAYRAGIPQRFSDAEIAAADAVFAILAREGGEKLVGKSDALSRGTFWTAVTPQGLTP